MSAGKAMMIRCGRHGERVSAVVCRHLLASHEAPSGFVENSSAPEDLQAWCAGCEEKFELEGGMTEAFRAFNGMSVVCVVCYAAAKERHSVALR